MERTKYTPKRLLSLLLALIMLLGMLPTAVFAADPVKQYSATSFINDGGARMDVELSCNNPLEVSTLPYEVTVDVRLKITVTGSNVANVALVIENNQDVFMKIGGKDVAESELSGSNYWSTSEARFVPSQSAIVNTFVANTEILNVTLTGVKGTLNKDRTISVPIETDFQVQKESESTPTHYNIKQNVGIKDVVLNKYIVSFAGDFKGRPVGNEMLLTSDNVTLPVLDDVEGYTFKGWLNEVTHAIVEPGETTVNQDTTFTAVWEAAQPKLYTVKFLTAKGSTEVFSTETVVEGKGTPRPAGTPEAPEAGKVFDKWCYTIEDGTDTKEEEFDFGRFINGDMTVYATWTDAPTKYTVKWDGVYTGVSNLPAVQEVAANTVIQKAPDEVPLREGYTFAGWATSENGNAVVFPQTITGNTTFYAKWTKNTVNITWPMGTISGVQRLDNNNKTSVPKGSTVSFNITLQAGYQFNQGDVQVNGIPLGWTIKENTDKTTTYYFSFVANAEPTVEGQKAMMTVTVNDPSIKKQVITLPSGYGYRATFANCEHADGSSIAKATGKSSYEFSYGDKFRISLKANRNMTASLDVNGTTHLTASNTGTTPCTDEHEVTDAVYNIVVYVEEQYSWRVDYVLLPNVGNYAPSYVSDGGHAIEPVDPQIDGYTFGGWYKDAAFQTKWDFTNDTVTRDTIIYGKLTKNYYSITYNPNVPETGLAVDNGTMPANVTANATTETGKEHGKPYPLSNARPTLTGYDFKGWATSKDGPVAYQPGEQYLIDADLTLWAVWAKKTFTVTVSSGAGYSTVPAGINTVEWNDNFTFTVTVDREYAATAPTVTYTTKENTYMALDPDATAGANVNQPSNNSSAVWVYTIPNVQTDYTVTINVARNTIYQVSYFVAKSANADGTNAARETTAFLIQSVEHGYYASMPAVPEVSGYKFHHWERYDENGNKVTVPNDAIFAKEIIAKTDFWAVYVPIVPTITIVNKSNICPDTPHNHTNGFGLENWKHGKDDEPQADATIDTNGKFNIAYGDSVAFDLVIDKGYDYSQLSVTANGLSMGLGDSITLNDDGSTTIHYVLNHVTGDTRISVANIQRKTITINYFANAGDDVAQVPGPQTGVKYYIEGATNDTISSFEPKRNGYTFLGWCENPAPTGEKQTKTVGEKTIVTGYKDGDTVYTVYQPGDTAAFEKDTNLYAIWEAQQIEAELIITDEFKQGDSSTTTAGTKLEYVYEGKYITLVGHLKLGTNDVNAQGTMTFYKRHRDDTDWQNATDWTFIGTTNVNGSAYGVLNTKVEDYQWGNAEETPKPQNSYRWEYKVVFTPANEEGYAKCEAADDLRVYSTAISWVVTKKTEADWSWVDAQNKLTVYKDSIADENKVANGVMVAKNTYWLAIPEVVELDGGRVYNGQSKNLTVGEHYVVQWQYQDETGTWVDYGSRIVDSKSVKVTPELSGHVFRARVYPVDASIYTKAATYDENGTVQPDKYYECLITKPTAKTALEDTAITLAVDGADDESNSVKINGVTPFVTDLNLAENGTHKAQYEGQTITLVAKVTKTDETTAVNMGTVEFYRQVTGENDTTSWVSIGTAKLEDEGTVTGEASIEFQMPKYVAGKTPIQNKEVFKAVYVQNVTYETSESANSEAYIKSAQLQIPVIMDADKPTAHEGKWLNDQDQAVSNGDKKTETTYNYHLGGLMAGIPHTFELKKTAYAVGATADYSVVARDGRAVPADMYTMKWWTLTDGKNWNETTTDDPAFSVGDTKFGERYRIRLTGKDVFDGSVQDSKDIVIGELQGVVVTVEAIDAITKTDETDVYQLNDITLTAKVEAAEQNAESKPEGTVAFYYEDTVNNQTVYQYLGEAKLETNTSGDKVATITTNELPVTPTTNIKRNVKITAVYFGDQTFKASENWVKTSTEGETPETWDITKAAEDKAEADETVKPDNVTVYSSVVYYCEHENKKEDGTDKGIHISLATGVLKPNNEATLKLSDIYTLDRGLGENLLDIIAKLDPNSDYEIQWQKLTGATAYTDGGGVKIGESDRWTNIDGEKNGTITLTVEQNTAYRAVITVKDQPITKGSYTKVKQAVEGRQIYYSNILMPTDASITMSVMVNTNKNGKNLEGITEGETVTANVFLSGAVGSVPNAEIEVMVEADAAKGNNNYAKSFTKATVNGWNSIDWDTKDVEPGFYTMRITVKTNTGYATKIFERSIIVRESSYDFNIGNLNPTYNGQTQGVTVTLNGFDFKGNDIKAAAEKSWTVKYYKGEVKPENLVEPSQAGTYKAVVTLPGSAYWTEHSKTVDFTISKRSVSIADAVAQAKVYDGTDNVNIVEVILNDATTAQDSTGLPTGNTGIINGDSIYATATGTLRDANAGENEFTVSDVQLHGDDAANYVWNDAVYTEPIYVSRSQVYGETAALISGTDVSLKLKKGAAFPADQVIKMIDQAGNKLEANKGYTLTFYYHSDTEIKQTNDLSKTGLYTVVARPNQDNYKSGVTMKFEVVNDATTYTPAAEPKPSTLITISNTAELYGQANGVNVALTKEGATYEVEYQNGANWTEARPTDAGRYLLKVTASTGDVAYGIYTITKAHPSISITAAEATYNSMPYTGATTEVTDYYLTYAGDVAIGFDTPTDGNVAEQAPVDAGDYVVTLHVNETQNYTAHEVSAPFVINKAPLTIKADSRKTTQYDAFPTMTATYDGLAAETKDGTPDTSLRDVQIAPEFIYNPTNGKPNYSNAALDQVGRVAVQPIDALSKNYKLSYGNGEYVKSETESNPDLEILGLPQSSVKDASGKKVVTVYYGDEIQLYPYGNYARWANNSSELTWSVDTTGITKGEVKIDATNGLLTVGGVGTFTVTLKRGATEAGKDEQTISTTVTVTAIQKEVQIALKEVDKVYNGSEQDYEKSNITVHDELYRTLANFEGKLTTNGRKRKNIGTQIPTAKVTGAWSSQSETYGGQFTINDKEATVAPGAQSTVYGTTEKYEDEKWTVTGEANGVKAVDNVNVASQTDVYDRLDVYDGYEILVAGTEDINYNVKYKTDHNDSAKDAEDSKVTEYTNVVFKSMTHVELNDATVYGETPNALDWALAGERYSTRSGSEYHDNLADFNLPEIFVYQVYDNCTGNKVTYKAANRTTVTNPLAYNQVVLSGLRHSEPNTLFETLITLNNNPAHNEGNGEHPNYTLFFNSNAGSGVSKGVKNYTMTNAKTGNAKAITTALGSLGYSGGNAALEDGENFIEGSANIAQRPVKVEKDTNLGTVTLYWKLPQKDLYTALLNILKAEATDDGRGLAKGHTIEDLDLIFTIGTETVSKTSTEPMNFQQTGKKTVTLTIGDTNYVLDGNRTFEVDFETMRIRAYYYNKTFTGFNVRIQKIGANSEPAGPLTSTKGLTFKVLKEVNGVLDPNTDYATNKVLKFNSADGTYGYFTGTYDELPLLGAGELYVFQLYEYGVPLERK